MEAHSSADLVTQALDLYRRVDADPSANASPAAALVARAREAGDTEALVTALRTQAWAERLMFATTRAKRLLDEAARVARRHGLDERLGEVLVSRAAVHQELGRLDAAHDDLEAAAPLVLGGSARQRRLQQAVLHHNSGRLTEAASLYRELLASDDTPADVRGKVGNNLGMVEAQRGLTDAALRTLDDAARAGSEVGPALTAGVLQTRGWVCVQAGRLSEGLRLFEEASGLLQASGLPLGELYMEYADALVDLRLLPEATAATARAVQEFGVHGIPLMGAEAQLRSARLALLSGDAEGAAAAAREAASAFRRQRRPAWAARADLVVVEARLAADAVDAPDLRVARRAAARLETLGVRGAAVHAHLVAARAATALGRAGPARTGLRRAWEMSRRGPVLVRLDGRVAAATEARLSGRDADVTRHCRAGLADLATHRTTLPSMELRALASGHGIELARLGVEVALRTGSPATVLRWLERTRSTAVAMMAPVASDRLEQEQAALRAVHAELAGLNRQPPDGQEPDRPGRDRNAVERQMALLAREREIEGRIRRATWVSAAGVGSPAAALGVGALRRALDGHVLVEYGALGGELFAVVVEPRRSRVVQLGRAQDVVHQNDSLAFALRRLTRRRQPGRLSPARTSADLALERLKALLVEPLGVPPRSPLVVVPSAVLHGLPWTALHDGPVSLAPSASAWARTLPEGRPPAAGVVLVAGPDLPGAVEEVAMLSRIYRDATVLTPPASTVDAVAGALDGAALVHLACHGRLRSDNPMFSALSLSDGPLTVQDLNGRGLAPARIVLASCESGAQVRYEGDELLGFVSALMAQGTTGIVASSIVVPDLESVLLMAALHAGITSGASLAAGLHAARDTLDLDAPSDFVTWCAYNAYGAP